MSEEVSWMSGVQENPQINTEGRRQVSLMAMMMAHSNDTHWDPKTLRMKNKNHILKMKKQKVRGPVLGQRSHRQLLTRFWPRPDFYNTQHPSMISNRTPRNRTISSGSMSEIRVQSTCYEPSMHKPRAAEQQGESYRQDGRALMVGKGR